MGLVSGFVLGFVLGLVSGFVLGFVLGLALGIVCGFGLVGYSTGVPLTGSPIISVITPFPIPSTRLSTLTPFFLYVLPSLSFPLPIVVIFFETSGFFNASEAVLPLSSIPGK